MGRTYPGVPSLRVTFLFLIMTARRNANSLAGDLPPIQREIAAPGKDAPRDSKAFPRSRDADFPARSAHPRGEVLEMADGISQETGGAVGGVFQNPFERGVGPWPFFQDGIVVLQIGGEGFVELQNGLRGFPLLPMTLGKDEGVHVKNRCPLRSMRFPFPRWIGRQMRAVFHAAMFVLAPDRRKGNSPGL